MHADVNACHCTQGCTDTIRKTALKLDWVKNLVLHWGTEPVSAGLGLRILHNGVYHVMKITMAEK